MATACRCCSSFIEIRAYLRLIAAGGKPADLPVERATNFITTVNPKTAKAIGVEMPTSLLFRADEVIE
jgi:putative tryptophan/tyrosine transport system substrate-binding protein